MSQSPFFKGYQAEIDLHVQELVSVVTDTLHLQEFVSVDTHIVILLNFRSFAITVAKYAPQLLELCH
jgi:hypothetical protein